MKRVEITYEQREWIKKRDKGICQNCGNPVYNKGNCHHIVAFSYAYFLGWSIERINNPTNLVLVCVPCHNSIHSVDRWDMDTENRLAEIAIRNTLDWKRRK